MYVIYEEDLVVGFTITPMYENCLELPAELSDLHIEQLRIQDGTVIDVSDRNEFYIDESGAKHICQDENNSRQLLQCKWYDILEKDENGKWIVVTLERAKQELMQEVYELRKEKENQGIFVDDFYLDTSETGRLNLANTINAYEWGLIPKTTLINWKVRSGEFRQVSYEQLKLFAGFVAHYIEELFTVEQTHDYAIKQLQTLDEVLSYDITTNWPKTEYTTKEM